MNEFVCCLISQTIDSVCYYFYFLFSFGEWVWLLSWLFLEYIVSDNNQHWFLVVSPLKSSVAPIYGSHACWIDLNLCFWYLDVMISILDGFEPVFLIDWSWSFITNVASARYLVCEGCFRKQLKVVSEMLLDLPFLPPCLDLDSWPTFLCMLVGLR